MPKGVYPRKKRAKAKTQAAATKKAFPATKKRRSPSRRASMENLKQENFELREQLSGQEQHRTKLEDKVVEQARTIEALHNKATGSYEMLEQLREGYRALVDTLEGPEPDGKAEVRVIQVVETTLLRRGVGSLSDPLRRVTQYWSTDGELLAEADKAPPSETGRIKKEEVPF